MSDVEIIGPYQIGRTMSDISLPLPTLARLSTHNSTPHTHPLIISYATYLLCAPAVGCVCSGQGIFAKVKLGEDEFRQKVAIKIFDKLLLSRSQHQLLQVEKELNSLRCCHHPNIVQFYEVLETDAKIYLVMEHLAAGELYDYILDQGKLSEPEAARLFVQIVSAVQHCHSHGIVHRDLKVRSHRTAQHRCTEQSAALRSPRYPASVVCQPENILLHTHNHSDGNQSILAKLCDFGLANYYDRSADIAQRSLHTQCGSPHYASPEILTGARYSGPLSDVWSLGVLLFAMLCGSLPFNARSVPLLIKKIVEGKFKFPKFLSASSRHLIALILQIQPENRPTLDEIARHPWLKQYTATPIVVDPQIPTQQADVPASTSPPFHRPVSRPEVINPESSRPQPGDLQRMMDKHKQAQRKVVAGQPAQQLPPSDILHFHSHSELSDGVGLVSSPHGVLAPGTPSHGGGTGSGAGEGGVKGAKVGAGFFSELLSFPSPRRRKGGVKCHLCGKSLQPRTTETGDFQLAKSQQRSAPTSPATSTPSSPSPSSDSLASKYELCNCLRNRSHSPVASHRSSDNDDASSTTSSTSSPVSPVVDREDPASFNPQSFRDAYFHPDDPKRKTNKQRRKEQETAQVSAAEQKRRDEDEERFLRACESGDVDTVILLIESPTDEGGLSTGPPLVDVRAKHIDNWTGLHYAARGGHVEVIQALLSSLQPLDINCRTKSSWSALMIAADKGWAEVCALLVRYGAAIHITNSDGKSAIFLARESGFHEIAQLLTHASSVRHKRHALLTEEKEEGKEKALNYELFRAAEYGDISKVKHLLLLGSDKTKDRTSRRSAGGSPGGGSPGGGSSGKEKEKDGSSDASQSATRYTVDIAATGIDNWTALHFAARKGRAAVVSLLLSHQPPCPVNAVTKNGWTALMMACDKGYVDCVRLLCEGGADVNVRSLDGYSAYSVAKEGEHHEICDILVHAAKKQQQDDKEAKAREQQQQPEREKVEDVPEHDDSAEQNGSSEQPGEVQETAATERVNKQSDTPETVAASSSNETTTVAEG